MSGGGGGAPKQSVGTCRSVLPSCLRSRLHEVTLRRLRGGWGGAQAPVEQRQAAGIPLSCTLITCETDIRQCCKASTFAPAFRRAERPLLLALLRRCAANCGSGRSWRPEAAMLQSLRLLSGCSKAVAASGTARLRCSQLGSRVTASSRPLVVRTMASEVERAQAA